MSKALYPGSFDPITFGHIDIAKRALKAFDTLVVCVSVNPNKTGNSLFTPEERVALIKEVLHEELANIEVIVSTDLTVTTAAKVGATHIVRGLRAVTDFEYEFQLTHANRTLDKTIDSVFFMTDNKYSFLSSTSVKEIAQFKGELSKFVPPCVENAMKDKF